MNKLRKIVAVLTVAMATALGSIIAPSAAHADACGDTATAWVPLIGSTWVAETYISGSRTTELEFTYTGRVAVTIFDDNLQTLVGQWDHDGGFGDTSFVWFGTDILDEEYRLTYVVTADDCGPFGKVNDAYGDVYQDGVGLVGVVYMSLAV